MPFYCDKCHKSILPLSEEQKIRSIKNLSWNNFRESKASGGRNFNATATDGTKVSMFIDLFGNARIQLENSGRWLADINSVEESPESCFEALKKLL